MELIFHLILAASIKGTLSNVVKGNLDLTSPIFTLALNDAMTYDKATKSGGPNGSIRFREGFALIQHVLVDLFNQCDTEKLWPMNLWVETYFSVKAQAATKATFLAAAIRKCGGNEEKGTLRYTAYGSNGQWGQFDKQFGRADAQEPGPKGRIPHWDKANVQEMKDKFSSVGLGPRQLAVMSAFLGPDQLATENLLATDTDVAPWVQKYQRSRETISQTDYEAST
ncbi:Thylakoid lumenal 29 kDa protein, chloroplastic [Ancistrocladus abbreviatus]